MTRGASQTQIRSRQAESAPPPGELDAAAAAPEHPMRDLERRVEMLCARCDALAREMRKLRDDNRKLRGNAERARQKIRDILSRLAESAEFSESAKIAAEADENGGI